MAKAAVRKAQAAAKEAWTPARLADPAVREAVVKELLADNPLLTKEAVEEELQAAGF